MIYVIATYKVCITYKKIKKKKFEKRHPYF